MLTADALVAGVHFFADDPPDAIARKALRVNLSDLAAKGARPLGFLLSLVLPRDWRDEWLAAFAAGSRRGRLATYDCPLMGGDTVSTPGPLTLSITAIGAVPQGAWRGAQASGPATASMSPARSATPQSASRSGRAGPDIPAADKAFLLERYLLPEPRLALIAAMAAYAHGGMDVSDGFVGDLTKMLRVSGVSARVSIDRLPLSLAARAAIAADPDLFEIAATGGDDYELLAAVAAANPRRPSRRAAAAAGVPLTFVGEAVEGGGRRVSSAATAIRSSFERGSYSHF